MKWEKKGVIYSAQNDAEWKNQFAMLPTPLLVDDSLRIFIGFCDKIMLEG